LIVDIIPIHVSSVSDHQCRSKDIVHRWIDRYPFPDHLAITNIQLLEVQSLQVYPQLPWAADSWDDSDSVEQLLSIARPFSRLKPNAFWPLTFPLADDRRMSAVPWRTSRSPHWQNCRIWPSYASACGLRLSVDSLTQTQAADREEITTINLSAIVWWLRWTVVTSERTFHIMTNINMNIDMDMNQMFVQMHEIMLDNNHLCTIVITGANSFKNLRFSFSWRLICNDIGHIGMIQWREIWIVHCSRR
jgi:hypothetical protein